jgi:NhaA family Na+:H+ antiporter
MSDARDEIELPTAPIGRVTLPLQRFLHVQAASGIVLLACTLIALALANSPWSEAYRGLWETEIGLTLGGWEVRHSLAHWINDGLMALFFFVIGLEVKRELVLGELRDPRRAALPIVAAIGGMVGPACVFLALAPAGEAQSGWGIPMATDIAFVVGCMAVLGARVPPALRVFLLSLAIADDVGAILVIAVGYTQSIGYGALGLAALGIGLVFALQRLGVRRVGVYTLVGVAIWAALFASGIHATLAGVVLGLATPTSSWVSRDLAARAMQASARALADNPEPPRELLARVGTLSREAVSPLVRLESALHPWVAFAVMPVFALANAGVRFDVGDLVDPVAVAVALGLLAGKPIGIALASAVAVRARIARLPDGVTWRQLVGAGMLAGIGFTMALFIAGLSLAGGALDAAKVGILSGSAVSAIAGLAVLAWPSRART